MQLYASTYATARCITETNICMYTSLKALTKSKILEHLVRQCYT